MRTTLLQLLRATPAPVSGENLSQQLQVTRSAVWKSIQTLRAEGYEIESTRQGYRFLAPPRQLCCREIQYRLSGHPWAQTLQVFDTIDSTNNQAKALGAQGAPAGTVLVADCQTGGRGRLGRSFLSPPGRGVYLSVLLRPESRPEGLMHLTCAVAEAMCGAVEDTAGFRPGIKWTNDLVWNRKKLAGILTELSLEAESGQVQYAVVGIGVNCAQTAGDFPPELRDMAASLEMAAGRPVDRNLLAANMIRSLSAVDATLLQDRARWMDRYRADCVTIGQAVSVSRAGEVRHGTARGVDDSGALLVDFGAGPVPVQSGEVSVRGMYGYV